MVVVMEERAAEDQIQHVIATLVEKGFDVHRSTGSLKTVLGAVGGNRGFDKRLIEVMGGVHEVLRITEPYKLASRTFKQEKTIVAIGDLRIGGDEVIVIAGPCSAETPDRSTPRPQRWSNQGQKCCEAAPSSLGAPRTASRGLVRRGSACSGRRQNVTTSSWSPRSWTSARSI